MPKLDEPFRNQEIFLISLFSIVQIWVLRVKLFSCSFWLIFCPLDPDTWIRIFLRIRIQEVKILGIQRIRILSTALNMNRFQPSMYLSICVSVYLISVIYQILICLQVVEWLVTSPTSKYLPNNYLTCYTAKHQTKR